MSILWWKLPEVPPEFVDGRIWGVLQSCWALAVPYKLAIFAMQKIFWEFYTWENASIAEAGKDDRRLCFASSSRKITVSSMRVAALCWGWALLLAIPNGIFRTEKWEANMVILNKPNESAVCEEVIFLQNNLQRRGTYTSFRICNYHFD